MSGSDDRFRRLDPPKRQNGDLFEHFGVSIGRAAARSLEQIPVRTVRACPECGWYRDPDAGCDNCGREAERA